MKTVQSFIVDAKKELSFRYLPGEAEHVIFLLFEEVKGYSKTDLYLKQAEQLSLADQERLDHFVGELKTGKPVQYVLGHAWFSGMKFRVNENVLIPRPETEELCEWLLSHISFGRRRLAEGEAHLNTHVSLLDIGTGSGCIAITLKKNLPDAAVHAIDISAAPLEVAKQNAQNNKAEIIFHQTDILSDATLHIVYGQFDIIVSNPPYIRKSEINSMDERVKDHEPPEALFVADDDALVFYRAIAAFSLTHLKENGRLFFEINEALGQDVMKMLQDFGFKRTVLKKDISGKDRMVMAQIV